MCTSVNDIQFGSGTLYITDTEGNITKLGEGIPEFSPESISSDVEILKTVKPTDTAEFTVTLKLSFRKRVKLFGFWNTVKAIFKRRPK